MSTQSNAANNISPPMAGEVSPIAVTTSASTQNLALCGNQAVNLADGSKKVGLQGRYVTFVADGADVGIIFGATQASVSGANAPVLATQGVNAVGGCVRIANGADRAWYVTTRTPWIGIVGSASGTLRIVASSP